MIKLQKKLLIIFLSIFFIIFILIGYLVINDFVQEKLLRNEFNKLMELNFGKDRFNRKIKTNFEYSTVEDSIKSYLDKYSTTTKKVYNITDDTKLKKILSISNYLNDGPDFSSSKSYISTVREDVNTLVDQVLKLGSEDSILDNIKSKNVSSYYVSLYSDLMLSDEFSRAIDDNEELLKSSRDYINSLLDTSQSVLDFLIINKGKWEIKDDTILFQTEDLLNQYNNLISGIK